MRNRNGFTIIEVILVVVMLGIFGAALLGISSCDINTSATPGSTTGVKKATATVTTLASGLTIEQENIKNKIEDDNRPGKIRHLYVISCYSGDVILYSTVKGKVTSSGKRLTPYSVAASTSGAHKSELGFPVNIGGKTHYTAEVLQDDGTYGSSIPYLYWSDTKGIRHKHYVSGGQIVHISDVPLVVPKVIINVEASIVK